MMKRALLPSASYWHWALLILSLLAVVLHFAFRWSILPPVGVANTADIPLLIVIAIGGIPLVLQIMLKILHLDFGADLLAVLALVTAAWLDEYLAAVLIIIMLSGGQALEVYAMRKASSVLLALAERMPSTAHRRRGEKVEEIALADIAIGDEIVIFPHETAPVDGVVIDGNGSMDESYLTGEPYQVSKAPGTSVLSGAINGEAVIVIRAEKLANDSRYAQIMLVMQEAEQKRPSMRRIGDQIGAVFAPLALLFALAAWYLTGDSTRFLAVLVVATPCPLLIAIPITLISAISMAARQAIIIKDPTVLELLPTCRTAIFDKTGTLTYGKPELTEIISVDGITRDKILQQTASLERYSKHPLANAIIQAAEKDSLALMEAVSVFEKPGQGLVGTVDSHEICVTHRKKLLKDSPDIANTLPPTAAGLECIIMMDGHYVATFRFRDTPRADGKSFINHLGPSHQFNKVMLVSGDRESEVTYLADLLGIEETLASQNPEQKVAIVRRETAKAPTLFMGDGINDAPALASATVGIAFGQHSSVTAEAAGAVIMENTLEKVDELLHISSAMRRIVLQSAIGGMTLSVIAMGFAAAGYITPVAGALLQEVIDILAIVNALRLGLGSKIETDLNT
ncbi:MULTISPECIES: heavy metal translocating P-type ATPase [unclassified Colwellia]|uniref:heavy metal translocating P-type ATPase n=1 Tax=unclassified Colwellia TaxID=196834 RepID=UPI001C70CF33|nr:MULTISPECIES: heavy metal translocating P-type ATPase [unclassified Colwellia]